ncbi:protein abnormal spindle [Drosophila rhopaloa]|uniref:Calponin-homology (CH) domain-containing protein n=1 Tax=Drosophila rhopaloa TaxID=1041015 RepID=A0ABM5HKY4_DRORH|nr:protein abnormal spindle [Drosophila rhopaloa]
MSAFEITVTPSRLKQKKRAEGREPAVVVMAPFSAKAIVQFEDVPVTKTARRQVRVLNPSDEDIEVKVMKAIREEHNLSLEWLEHTVPARDEVSMELVWSPQIEVACKETLQLIDNRNFRKDVMIILKSKSNQPVKTARKFPTVGKTLQLKSPTGAGKTMKSIVTAAMQQKKRLSAAAAPASKQHWRATAPARPAARQNPPVQAPLAEKNVYKQPKEEPVYISPQPRSLKENLSPMTPGNLLDVIDNLRFTPLNDTRAMGSAAILPDNLAAWPTPTLAGNAKLSATEMRPRRITTDDLEDQPATNKTFDVRHSETINLSLDTLDCSKGEGQMQTPLNKTTTIVHATQTRALACIREEEGPSPPRTPTKSAIHDLKRDIKLVGSPLRKYSESMKDLSLLSPQTKYAIQGSMPNLNEMKIRSIEQNRYYQEQQPQIKGKDLNSSSSSEASLVGQQEFLFNHNEILAQSSRFNLHEVGRRSLKGSPVKNPNPHKRRSHELSFSDAPSNESLHRNETLAISPPKKQRVEDTTLTRSAAPANASARSSSAHAWSATQSKKFKLAQTMSLMKKTTTPRKVRDTGVQAPVKLYDSELYMQTYINPDPFAATTTTDPFLASTMYLDEQAVERHQADFKKWLNALVSIPADLDADLNSKIDVGKLFNEVRNKELVVAQTKEEQSMNYLTKYRLETLRKAAVELFFSEQMRLPCSKVAVYVNKQALRIRSDRNLHLDVVMQRTILELLLCFNPLWLRLGLEVVFGEKIQMQSNRDIVGLSTFILNRLFRNKFEEQRYSKAYTLTEEYAETIKKHSLQKILFLLLFLDQAKQKRIVKHNPCLFVKKSPHKETKDILLRFSSELLANIGDITRELRRLGYVLQHRQTFLDEFDYAFNNLAVDLRDGVRLTRVMEIILLRDDLTRQLRVPAISRLQRIFNVKLALGALGEANFQLGGDISAPDIVDGHREKTLSLLWQIIYKFRSPKFHAAAAVLQKWWRRRWLYVVIQRRIRHKELMRRHRAATVIQAVFRGHQMRKYAKLFKAERIQAAIVLQKFTRRYLAQKQLYQSYHSIVTIQRWWRAQQLGRECRRRFLELRQAAIFLQRIWRRRLFAKKLLAAAATARLQRSQKQKAAASYIQMQWRSYQLGKIQRQKFLRQRELIVLVQRRMRGKWSMLKQRKEFRQLKQAAINVQQRWRAELSMRKHRAYYLALRAAVLTVQAHRRATIQMRIERNNYQLLRKSVICLQQRMRANWKMREEREKYLQLRYSTILIQRRYRLLQQMIRDRNAYLKARQCIINVQRRWRATVQMRRQKENYVQLQSTTRFIQTKYRAKRQMQKQRDEYLRLKKAALVVQQRRRALLQMRKQRLEFLQLREVTIKLQRRFHAQKAMRFIRAKYRGTQAAVSCLQMHWRGHLLRKRERSRFLELRQAAITLQRRYRARLAMIKQLKSYNQLKKAAIIVQTRYRAKKEMQKQVVVYQKQREAIIKVQQRFRGKLEMRRQMGVYQKQRQAVIRLQKWWRSVRETRLISAGYRRIRLSSLSIQRKWRATVQARRQRQIFLDTIRKVRLLQTFIRATLEMRQQRMEFEMKRKAALAIQRRFRARQAMLRARQDYQLIRSSVILVQRKFRANRSMKQARQEFVRLRTLAIHLQQKFRGKRLMVEQRERFLLLRRTSPHFQARARGFMARKRFQALMTPEMMELIRQKRAAKVIQRYWRGHLTRRRQRHQGLLAIRKRLILLREEATAVNSVRCKVQEAVRFLRGRFIASDALAVLNRLDRLSRTVPHLLMWCSEFMSTFCYGIMAQAIRSEVDKQLIERCSRIILNLARYNSTTVNTFQEGGLVTIAQMLLRWCDKDSEIFNTLCTLIWVFAHCPKKRKIIHDYMTNTEAIYMVRETKKLVARKEKMKQNARKPPPTSFGRHQTQKMNFTPSALPSLEPDFGIIRYSPYTFVSSVFAFDTILCKLQIDMF